MKANELERGLPNSTSDSNTRKRGRPRKSIHAESREARRSYWLGEVFVDQGWTWATELVEIESTDGRGLWQACPLCLGREEDIIPVLEGHRQMPEDIHRQRRALLASILEVNKYGGVKVTPGATHLQRGSHARTLRNRQKNARRLKARERLSLRKTYR